MGTDREKEKIEHGYAEDLYKTCMDIHRVEHDAAFTDTSHPETESERERKRKREEKKRIYD